MRQFFDELRRRNVHRVAVAFVVASWLIVQVVDTVSPAFGFGDDAVRYAVIVLAIAFLPVLALAWVFELTPEGLKLERDFDRGSSKTPQTRRRLDRAIIVVLALATTYFAVDKFLLDSGDTATQSIAAKKSIVVLPFVDLSENKDQEYISDGIAEELINLLAQIPQLRVISRSSAFSFKGQAMSTTAIAKRLKVDHVLEGSVRRAGDRLRVTVQLINAQTDEHLFSQNYDRTLNDIFDIQDEIAASVVDRLKLILFDDRPQPSAVDPRAYDEYLRGRYLAEQIHEASMRQAQVRLENAVRIAPDFADAWVALGDVYRFRTGRGQMDQQQGLRLAHEAAAKALAIDPENPGAYVLRGRIASDFDWDWQSADADFQMAARLDPSSPHALRGAAGLAQTLGRPDEALRMAQEAVLLDPVSVPVLQNLALIQLNAGRLHEAEATVRGLIARDPTHPTVYALLSWIYVLSGNASAALDAAHKESAEPIRIFSEAIASFATGDGVAAEKYLNELIDKYGDTWYYQIAMIYAYTNRADEAFAWLDKAYAARDTGMTVMLTEPFLENLHDDPRWHEMLARMNLPTQ